MAKDKKELKRKPGSKVYSLYEVSGNELKRKSKSCPKCGPSVFMASHKDRMTCGKCGYTEFNKKD